MQHASIVRSIAAIVVVLLLTAYDWAADAAVTPVVKPVTPAAGSARVRVPIIGDENTPYQTKGKLARPKGKPGEPIDIAIGINTGGGNARATAKMVKSWGYSIGPDKTVILPELALVGFQVAPKPSKGKDVLARIRDIKVEVLDDVADGTDKVLGTDLLIGVYDIIRHHPRSAEPRLHFREKFLDLTLPNGSVKPAGIERESELNPLAPLDGADLATFVAPLTTRLPGPAFATASINGFDTVKGKTGMNQPLAIEITGATTTPVGVILSLGAARTIGIDVDLALAKKNGFTLASKQPAIEARVKELRISASTGKKLDTPREIVIKDFPVLVDVSESNPFVWLGPSFINRYFPDAVFAVATDGTAKLYGRVSPNLLQEAKPRKRP